MYTKLGASGSNYSHVTFDSITSEAQHRMPSYRIHGTLGNIDSGLVLCYENLKRIFMKLILTITTFYFLMTSISQEPNCMLCGKWRLKKHLAKWENKSVDCVKSTHQYNTIVFLTNGTYSDTLKTNNKITDITKGKWKTLDTGIRFFDNYSVYNKNVSIADRTVKVLKLINNELIIKEFRCIEGYEGDEGTSYYEKLN